MAVVLSEHDFSAFMGRFPFEKKWLGMQFKIEGKKPLPTKTRKGADVVIVFADTRVFMKGKGFFLEELLRNHEIGVHVDASESMLPSTIAFQYDLWG